MFTLDDILQGNANRVVLHSNITPDPALSFRSAHHDSRQIEPGDLYIALKGARVDGHQFIAAAFKAGAIGTLCEKAVDDVPDSFLQIIVPDVVEALHATAHARVQRQPYTTYIGITGSNGKTSTKEAVATVLSHKAPTLKTQASYNTEIGYPLTLLRLEEEHQYAVLEMGAQWVGELAQLCKIANPDWSIITNVGNSHLEYFGSQERVAIAKSELVQALQPDGTAILNYDDPRVRAMREKTQARVLYYGTHPEADVQASNIGGDTLRGLHFTLNYRGEQERIQLRLPGAHGVTIALAAAAAGLTAGMSLKDVSTALMDLRPFKRRGEIKPGPNGSVIIDDSYNANQQSILAIVHAMYQSELPPSKKRWVVLGDILELGEYAREEHLAVGAKIVSQIDYLIAIGDQARYYAEGAREAGMPSENIFYYEAHLDHPAELEAAKRSVAALLLAQTQQDDLILLKASLGVGMDALLTLLQSEQV